MTARYAENRTARYFDGQAVDFMRQAAKWDKQADTARTDTSRAKYAAKANQLRQKAIDALEKAKNASARSSKR